MHDVGKFFCIDAALVEEAATLALQSRSELDIWLRLRVRVI